MRAHATAHAHQGHSDTPAPAAPAAGGAVRWICPMHPEIVAKARATARSAAWPSSRRSPTGRRRERRARRHAAALLGRARADAPALRARDERSMLPGNPLQHALAAGCSAGSSSRSRRPSSLWGGWPFFVRGWRLRRQPPPQHVHADRARHGRRLGLQRRRAVSRPALFPAVVPRPRRQGRRLLRGRRRHHRRSCCSARSSSCARASRTGAAIRALLGLAPKTARRIAADGREDGRAARRTSPSGDRLRVRPGEQVPVDGVDRSRAPAPSTSR